MRPATGTFRPATKRLSCLRHGLTQRHASARLAAQIAVGIAGRHDGEPAVARQLHGAAVADGLASLGRADLDDPRLARHHRPHRIGSCADGFAAIERDTGTREIEVIVAAEEDASRSRKA